MSHIVVSVYYVCVWLSMQRVKQAEIRKWQSSVTNPIHSSCANVDNTIHKNNSHTVERNRPSFKHAMYNMHQRYYVEAVLFASGNASINAL